MAGLTLKKRYEKLADDYLHEFVRMMNLSGSDLFWLGDDVGTMACIDDWYIEYEDIRTAVDNHVSFKNFNEWYDYSTDVSEIDDNLFIPTLEAWLNGAFQPIPQKRRDELKQLKQTFLDAVMEEINKSEKKEEDNVEEV